MCSSLPMHRSIVPVGNQAHDQRADLRPCTMADEVERTVPDDFAGRRHFDNVTQDPVHITIHVKVSSKLLSLRLLDCMNRLEYCPPGIWCSKTRADPEVILLESVELSMRSVSSSGSSVSHWIPVFWPARECCEKCVEVWL